jgi:hypothetical protein
MTITRKARGTEILRINFCKKMKKVIDVLS